MLWWTSFGQTTPVKFSLEVVPDFFQVRGDGNLIQPTGVAVNSKGHIFIFNKGNRKLMEFSGDGTYVRSFGMACL